MSESRRYTVTEIDALRSACKDRWLYGTTNMRHGGSSRSYMQSDLDAGVEQLVRTYMAAGITAKDIYEADKNKPISADLGCQLGDGALKERKLP